MMMYDKTINKIKKRLYKRIKNKIIEKLKPNNLKWIEKCFVCFVIIVLLYFGAHSLILHGVLKERESRNCINPNDLLVWETALDTTQSVCVDVQKSQLDEIRKFHNEELKIAQEETEKWKNYYLYLQKQNEEESLKI